MWANRPLPAFLLFSQFAFGRPLATGRTHSKKQGRGEERAHQRGMKAPPHKTHPGGEAWSGWSSTQNFTPQTTKKRKRTTTQEMTPLSGGRQSGGKAAMEVITNTQRRNEGEKKQGKAFFKRERKQSFCSSLFFVLFPGASSAVSSLFVLLLFKATSVPPRQPGPIFGVPVWLAVCPPFPAPLSVSFSSPQKPLPA